MIRPTTSFSRCVAVLCTLTLVNLCVPMGLPKLIGDALPRVPNRAPKPVAQPSRLLSAKEMKSLQGKWSGSENPYLAGQAKWDVVYKGVDIMSGNFSTSATDLSFEGGYGIPVNVTRS